ncbi:uncharacterized protein AMSG_04867 [Thecamonas trahens ATCC 50062]|uniref:Uncharacterized protein n=1 Tax=Thecamonas trahens ATCC 50062 TaxID=461836 RepID=A0A0L0D7U1_THETB|nr:hypothetical protein AMSG_04867 [Thecamonas trahens ATCC 50062]KNC48419.1 hypothetical protein AMSG_04867 [Thecamonas trahens ATCC 50062]|eukprot:XP_013758536.1 hypothetical protein AMSG_04867 [Thecamonas trahens ATCC 50062]
MAGREDSRIQLTGAALSGLLFAAVAASGGPMAPVEGLLFGSRTVRSATALTDDTTAAQVTAGESTLSLATTTVASVLPTGSSLSFYRPSGAIDGNALEDARAARTEASPGLCCVGWWRARKGLPLTPTLRETAVLAGLAQELDSDAPPPLLVLLRTAASAAIHDVSYAVYSLDPATGTPVMVRAPVTNLVDSSNAEYAALSASSLFPRDAGVAGALAAATAPLAASAEASETLFSSVLRHVASLSDDLVATHASIAAVQAEIRALEAAATPPTATPPPAGPPPAGPPPAGPPPAGPPPSYST